MVSCATLDRLAGRQLLLKCEHLQKVGAFKFRGATNAVFSLTEQEVCHGVGTHSSGNHAAALALAARTRGVQAYVVMPQNAPQVKKDAVAGYGAEITFCTPTLEAREQTLAKVVEETGAAVVHPYNDYRIIAGQATAAMELMDQGIIGAVEEAFQFGFPLDAEAIVVIELDGPTAGLDEQLASIVEICNAHSAREVLKADTPEERALLWKCRKMAVGAVGRLSRFAVAREG